MAQQKVKYGIKNAKGNVNIGEAFIAFEAENLIIEIVGNDAQAFANGAPQAFADAQISKETVNEAFAELAKIGVEKPEMSQFLHAVNLIMTKSINENAS